MHTSLGDVVGAVRRPAGAAAAAAAAAGLVAAMVPALPAWRLVATITVSGTSERAVVTSLTGADTGAAAWLATVAGLVAVVTALTIAVDLPLPRAEGMAVASALALGAVAALLAVASPEVAAFGATAVTGDALPRDVAVEYAVRPAWGTWVLAASALVVAAGTTTAVRRG